MRIRKRSREGERRKTEVPIKVVFDQFTAAEMLVVRAAIFVMFLFGLWQLLRHL